MPCACADDCALNARLARQRATLRWVLAINAIMFLVIAAAALYGDSAALLSDSLDNLGDALTYALSLYVVARGSAAKARVALFKGALILLAALVVLGHVVYRVWVPGEPLFEVMGLFSVLGLIANGVCLGLLWRHRHEDINMSSVWECSRNDIAGNIAVFLAAGGVWLTGSAWPDLVVGGALALLLMRSAGRVIGAARRELRAAGLASTAPDQSGGA
jgi:Co/Zn/Cd efflux system component